MLARRRLNSVDGVDVVFIENLALQDNFEDVFQRNDAVDGLLVPNDGQMRLPGLKLV